MHAATAQDTAITFTEVRAIDSMSKATIFEKVKMWSVTAFNKVAGATQMDDKESGILAYDATATLNFKEPAKAKNKYYVGTNYPLTCKITVQVRDGRYRIQMADIKYKWPLGDIVVNSSEKAPYKYTFGSQSAANLEWANLKTTLSTFANELFASLYQSVSKKDDW